MNTFTSLKAMFYGWKRSIPPLYKITLTEPWVSQPEAKNTCLPTASKDMAAKDYSICLPSAG